MSHALIRTSSKGPGKKFVGRCTKCGTEGLRMAAVFEDCPADTVMSDAAALLDILDSKERE